MAEQTIMEGIDMPRAAIQRRIEEMCGESCRAEGYAPVNWADLDVIAAVAMAAQNGAMDDAQGIKSIKIALYSGDVIEIIQIPELRGIKIRRINKRIKIG